MAIAVIKTLWLEPLPKQMEIQGLFIELLHYIEKAFALLMSLLYQNINYLLININS